MSLANLRIATKLLLGFGLLLVLLLGVSTFAIVQLQRVNAQADEINSRWLPSVHSADDMRLAVAVLRRQQYGHMVANDKEHQDEYEKKIAAAEADFQAAFAIYDPLPQTGDEEKIFAQFKSDWKAYQEASVAWLALSRANKDEEARALLAGPLMDLFRDCDKALKSIAEINFGGSVKAGESAHAIGRNAFLMIALATATALVAGLVAATLLARGISRPIQAIAAAVRQLAGGDLTVRVAVSSKDEVGMMGASLNETVESLHQVLAEIREAADQTAASGEELSASAQNISSGAQTQASSVEEISASVQELSKSIGKVATDAVEASQVAQSTSTTAETGSRTVDRSIEGMKAINDSSTHIAKIIGVINQIANQTNLLALNAAIEAASAGEHGLGFAVVADEVRKLAERSSTAAQEIAQLIDESGKRVSDGATLSQEVGRSLQGILEGITRTKQGMAGISASTEKQAQTAMEVSKGVEGISAITEENSASAEEMAASAEELSAQAQRLQELVARFTLSDAGRGERRAEPRKSLKAEPRKSVTADGRKPQRKTITVSSDQGELVGAGSGKALYHE